MSAAAPTPAGPVTAGQGARAQLDGVMSDLSRARWRQLCAGYAWTATFAWLATSTAAVLILRLAALPVPAAHVVLALLGACTAGALAASLLRRPDPMQVSIEADLKLNLKQRLSTAFELARTGSDAVLTERLAAQAVKARLPARSRSMLVFPMRINAFGMLTPVAAIALVLSFVVDLDAARAPDAVPVDESVVSEGVRLREYGQRMEGRARREQLPRSTEAARQLQRLGNKMHGGALSRREALTRLDELDEELDAARRAALAEGAQTAIGPLKVNPVKGGAPMSGAADPGALLRQLLDGTLKLDDARSLGSDPGTLARMGISGAELADALSRFSQGEQDKLREMLEKLTRNQQARHDARELGGAREQVERARESLGGRRSQDTAPDTAPTQPAAGGDDAGPGTGERSDADIDSGFGMPGGSRPGDHAAGGDRPPGGARRTPQEVDTGVVLKATGQPGEGGVFVSEARVMPRIGTATIDDAAIDARFAPQVEEVLANERFAAHHKEFIRRYFLNLSEGVRQQEPSP